MITYALQIKYSGYHPAYGHSYHTGVTRNGIHSYQLHSKFDNLFLSLDKVYELVREFSANRPCWFDGNASMQYIPNEPREGRIFDTRYIVNWDFASIDNLKFYPKTN